MNEIDVEMITRCATAVRNLIGQVPAGHGRWADWVPEHLDRLANQMSAPDEADEEE
jgi:hypothetical protein